MVKPYPAECPKWTCPPSILGAQSIIDFGKIKISWSGKSVEPGQTAQMDMQPGLLNTGGNGLSLLVPARSELICVYIR